MSPAAMATLAARSEAPKGCQKPAAAPRGDAIRARYARCAAWPYRSVLPSRSWVRLPVRLPVPLPLSKTANGLVRSSLSESEALFSPASGCASSGPVRHHSSTICAGRARVAEPGRRAGLRIRWPKGRGGSNPPSRTRSDLRTLPQGVEHRLLGRRVSGSWSSCVQSVTMKPVSWSHGSAPLPPVVARSALRSLQAQRRWHVLVRVFQRYAVTCPPSR
jgi:hypothetical protein